MNIQPLNNLSPKQKQFQETGIVVLINKSTIDILEKRSDGKIYCGEKEISEEEANAMILNYEFKPT